MQNVNEVMNRLHNGIVEFEYKKKDGSTRKAKGTLCSDFLPEKEMEEIVFDIKAIDTLCEIKHISFEEYMETNNLELLNTDNGKYIFLFRKKKKDKQDGLIIYYDLETNSFRSFIKDNFIRNIL